MTMVHPSGWRNVAGVFKKTQDLLKSKEMLYLKMFTFKDGLDTFNAKINFDFYCLRNNKNTGFLTDIICEDKTTIKLDISKLEFIPGENIKEIYSLIAKDGEEKVHILNNSSYHHQRTFMSKTRTEEFKYPCVYMVSYLDKPTYYFSNRNDRNEKGEHFVPKIIWGGGSTGLYIDYHGECGLTEFGSAIIDDVQNLKNIEIALKNQRFIKNIMLFKNGLGDKYNRKIIATFRKDFWKEFID
jgi:hypothetical protein